MKTIKFLTLAFSICLFAACTTRNDGKTEAEETPAAEAAPGVGAAPDNSESASDSSMRQADSTSAKQP